jgi:hypothetical protein
MEVSYLYYQGLMLQFERDIDYDIRHLYGLIFTYIPVAMTVSTPLIT